MFCAAASTPEPERAAPSPAPTSPAKPTIFDKPRVVRPGQMVDVATIVRNWWSFPAVGFNSILEIPVQRLEITPPENPPPVGTVVVPNSIFGLPLRKDLVHKVYWLHRKALAGYQDTMSLYKWEWPGRNAKHRSQKGAGKGRMGRRTAPGRYHGSFTHPIRPKDWRAGLHRRLIWTTMKVMLSVKFAQNAIKVVDSFNLQSHKTKHLVKYLRRIVGPKCKSAMLVHEGNVDVNDNFRWACAHIASVHRENVEGVSVYNLLKYHELIITEAALSKLMSEIQNYPKKRKWGQKFATPDGKPAPVPEKVPGWNAKWIEKKERLRQSEFRAREFYLEQKKWKWSPELKGPLRIPRHDPLAGFRVKDFILSPEKPVWEKLESLYIDEEPIREEGEDDEFDEFVDLLEESHGQGMSRAAEVIEDKSQIQKMGLAALANSGRKSARSRSAPATSETEGNGGKADA